MARLYLPHPLEDQCRKLSFQIPYIDYYKKIRPQSVTDPFNDPTFQLETEVPGEFGNSFIVYSFDFRNSKTKESEN